MSFNQIVQKDKNGHYVFPRVGKNRYKPLKTIDLRDPRIAVAINEIKQEYPDPATHNELLSLWGYVDRDELGNYAPVDESSSILSANEKAQFNELINGSKSVDLDPSTMSIKAMSQFFRNLPRTKQYIIHQEGTTFTMSDKVRNEVVHMLVAHQKITGTSSENWMVERVVGGQVFTVSEHVADKAGYKFKDPAFFNHLFQKEIDDEFVELFKKFQVFKTLPDFTKYTEKGVDNEKHLAEHYCCLINSLIQLGCDGSVLQEARTCITGLHVPKSSLEEFCNIARIKIKLYWYENNTKQGKKLK
jgi:hypothetical protein